MCPLKIDHELMAFLIGMGNLYGSFIRQNYVATKVAERYVADQRFILSKLKYSGGQRMLYVVIPTEQDEVRIIAIEGYNGDLMFMKAATRAEIGVAMGLIFKYNESMAIFG